MSDQGAEPTQKAPETEPATESGPPEWLGPIEERMNELRDQNVALTEHIAALTAPQEEEDEEDFELYTEEGDLTPEAAQAIIDQRVQEALSTRLSERDATDALNLRDVAFDELRERVPALQDDKLASGLVQEVAAELRDAGYEAIVNTPLFVDLIEQRHKAMQFDERAAAEQPPKRGVVLEAGAGATQQHQEEEVDWGERIVKAAERLSPKI